ncbi:uncharacterized protein LOC110179126 [Drosophila serrata]|uniref:uncharacterized protein LOC110179126 n=1 Tax=Drosophila serrata TaxID=7274 RepID=UPI000A1D3339|nr:uncharacterized protein LOC110179126 [Drosophila serrata]
MHRFRDNARQAQRQEANWEETLRLAQMDVALLKINDSNLHYKEDVENQVNLNPEDTEKELLQLKWLDFLALKIDSCPSSVPTSTVHPRSRSVNRKPQRTSNLQRSWTRVQSVDREKMDEDPTFYFERWPRYNDSVPSMAGSLLSMAKPLEEHCDNMQTSTSKEIITMKPQMMKPREVLMDLKQIQKQKCD